MSCTEPAESCPEAQREPASGIVHVTCPGEEVLPGAAYARIPLLATTGPTAPHDTRSQCPLLWRQKAQRSFGVPFLCCPTQNQCMTVVLI